MCLLVLLMLLLPLAAAAAVRRNLTAHVDIAGDRCT